MIATKVKRYTPAEYLSQEEQATVKSELIEGEIFPMAGASANHNRLTINLCRLLPLEVAGQHYEMFMSDLRLWLPLYESYTYPDVMAVAGVPEFTNDKQTALTNPCLIVEVLSPSTERYDKAAKFELYRSIAELQEYVLVDQSGYRVNQYTKVKQHQWLLTEWMGKDAVVPLQSVPVEVALQDLYKRVVFEG